MYRKNTRKTNIRRNKKSIRRGSRIRGSRIKKRVSRARVTVSRVTVSRRTSRRNRKMRLQKGAGILPSSVSQLGYSVLGSGQSILDGWNGRSSSFSYVNPSPENQIPIDGLYKANHMIV